MVPLSERSEEPLLIPREPSLLLFNGSVLRCRSGVGELRYHRSPIG
jgi:hypothetical protein